MALSAIRKLLQKRRAKRRLISSYVGIYDLETEEFVGHLSNRSRTGLMITSTKPFEPRQAYHLGIESGSNETPQTLQALDVQCLWAKQEFQGAFYYSGFQIEDLAPRTKTQLEAC